MPNRLQTVATIFGVMGTLAVLDAVGLWMNGIAQVPIVVTYLAAAAVLFSVRRPSAPTVALVLAALPPLFGVVVAVAVASGWQPVDFAVSMTDEPLSESPSDLAPYVLYVGLLTVLTVWAASVLRRDETRAYYADRSAQAV